MKVTANNSGVKIDRPGMTKSSKPVVIADPMTLAKMRREVSSSWTRQRRRRALSCPEPRSQEPSGLRSRREDRRSGSRGPGGRGAMLLLPAVSWDERTAAGPTAVRRGSEQIGMPLESADSGFELAEQGKQPPVGTGPPGEHHPDGQ